MLRKISIFVMTVFLCAVFVPVVFALETKEEWNDKSADFKQIKRIKIEMTLADRVKDDEIGLRRLKDLVDSVFVKGITSQKREMRFEVGDFTPATAPPGNVAKDSVAGTDAAIDDPGYDAVLNLKILSLGYSRALVPGEWKTETTYVSQPVVIPKVENGRTTYETEYVSTPIVTRKFVPEHYIKISNAGLEFTLIDAKTQKKIWILLDSRENDEMKEPIGMAERILKRTADQFLKLK